MSRYKITDYDKEFHEIHKGSIILRDLNTLFQWYLLSELDEAPKLPEEVKDVIYDLFSKTYRGHVTDDACDYNNGDRSTVKTKKTDRRVRWIIRPKAIKYTDDGWIVQTAENPQTFHIALPGSGYVELTDDGDYRPETGTPFSTVKTRKQAEKSWTKRGYDPAFAQKAVSFFQSRNEREGVASVVRWYNSRTGSIYSLDFSSDPGYIYKCVGSFPAKRIS